MKNICTESEKNIRVRFTIKKIAPVNKSKKNYKEPAIGARMFMKQLGNFHFSLCLSGLKILQPSWF